MGGAGRGQVELAQIQQATRGLVHALLLQPVGRTVVVDRDAVGKQRQHRAKHVSVALLVEVLGSQEVGDANDAGRVLENRTEHRFLRLDAVRREAEVTLLSAVLACQ